eukprot:6915686-Prymnesium_polylepis.1
MLAHAHADLTKLLQDRTDLTRLRDALDMDTLDMDLFAMRALRNTGYAGARCYATDQWLTVRLNRNGLVWWVDAQVSFDGLRFGDSPNVGTTRLNPR